MRISRNAFYKAQFRKAFDDKPIDSTTIAMAIAQFERTLLSYRSRYDSVLAGLTHFTPDERDGFELTNDMTKGDCLHCHSSDSDPLGTIPGFSNNGLDTAVTTTSYKDKGRGGITHIPADNGKFKIPSLRNIFFTAPYMHDGRFKTVEEVIDFYSEGVNTNINIDSKMGSAHQKGVHLSAEEKRKILLFLKTMSDYAFISDSTLSNPFINHSVKKRAGRLPARKI
jgi:cytochrome c peroxidase